VGFTHGRIYATEYPGAPRRLLRLFARDCDHLCFGGSLSDADTPRRGNRRFDLLCFEWLSDLFAAFGTAKTHAGIIFRFSARRFLRIYPPYLVSLALIGAVMWFYGDPQVATFVGYLPGLLTFAYRPDHWINMGVGILWTLHVEFWFYMTFPVLFLLCGRSKHFVGILAALLPISWIAPWAVVSAGISGAPAASPLSAVMWMDTLLLGAIVATLNKRGNLTILSGAAYPIQFACVVSLVSIALFSGMSWVIAARMASVLTAVPMAAYLARPFIISQPIVSWIGAISYLIYLLHGVPAGYVEIPWIDHAKSLPMLAAVIIGAALMHYLLEKPAIRLAREITSHDKRPLFAIEQADFITESRKS